MTSTPSHTGSARPMFGADHELYRSSVARFIADKITPSHAEWERQGLVPRQLWREAGRAGLLLPGIDEEYGGGGGDFLFSAIVVEEIARALATGVTGFTTHSENVAPYLLEFGSEAQKREFLPKMACGEVVGSLAMTEPGAGSDLKAIRTTARAVAGGFELTGQARAASACSGSIPAAPAFHAAGCWTRSASWRRTRRNCSSTRSSCRPTW